MRVIDVVHPNYFGPGISDGICVFVVSAFAAALLFEGTALLVELLRGASRERASLAPGVGRVEGVVELGDEQQYIVRARVDQTTFTLIDPEAKPFFVRTASGERVRVDVTDAKIDLRGESASLEFWRDVSVSEGLVELIPDRFVTVYGQLDRRRANALDYRGGRDEWCMIADNGTLRVQGGRRTRERASRKGRRRAVTILVLLGLAATALLPLREYYHRRFGGEVVLARCVGRSRQDREEVFFNKNSREPTRTGRMLRDYSVRYRADLPFPIEGQVPVGKALYDELPPEGSSLMLLANCRVALRYTASLREGV